MKPRTKTILLLIVSQAACLVIGLWLQDRFVLALARWNTEQPANASSLELMPSKLLGKNSVKNNTNTTVTKREENKQQNFEPTQQPTKPITAKVLRIAMLQATPLTFIWICGLQGVAAYLILTRIHVHHAQRVEKTQEELVKKSKELVRTRDAVIFGLAKLAESRDPDTGHHLERIALYSNRLATALRLLPEYRHIVTPSFIRMLGVGSALHDIGKVGVEDRVLLKNGKLTAEERRHMQTHTTRGGECIRQIEKRLGASRFLSMACEIAFHHHERWDGAGYPASLFGNEIPLSARIVAIADVYDALVSRRVYKDAIPHEKCVEIIRRESGKQFDPKLIDIFLKIEGQFKSISNRFQEEPALDADLKREGWTENDSQGTKQPTAEQKPTRPSTEPKPTLNRPVAIPTSVETIPQWPVGMLAELVSTNGKT